MEAATRRKRTARVGLGDQFAHSKIPVNMDKFIVAAVAVTIYGLFAWREPIRAWIRKWGASSWPATTAVVEQTCAVQMYSGSRNRISFEYIGGILYSYKVSGEFYSGQHNFSGTFGSTEAALAEPKRWVGKTITIHYRQDKPEVSAFLNHHWNVHHPHKQSAEA